MTEIDMKFMDRAIQLARFGQEGAHPNPMVGAVIVDNTTGLIVGEGWHRHCGEGHAEVNAVAAARSRGANLAGATIYVTLEPCAHYGKTPPCAQLIIDCGIRHVVVGCIDPFSKVAGKGIAMMRQAGIEVTLAPEEVACQCRAINPAFFAAHTRRRPYVILKWARSADGFIDRIRSASEPSAKISTPTTQRLVHQLRASTDAITVGSRTEQMDRPALDARKWPAGRAPRRVRLSSRLPLADQLESLYADGVTSLLVEGGATLAESFISEKLWDMIRVETSPAIIGNGIAAPSLPSSAIEVSSLRIGDNSLKTYKNTYK